MKLDKTNLDELFKSGYSVVSSHSDGSEHFLVIQKSGSSPYIIRCLGHRLSEALSDDGHFGIADMTFTMVGSE